MICREWNLTGHRDGKRPLVRFRCRQEDKINPLAPELFFLISAHPVYKM